MKKFLLFTVLNFGFLILNCFAQSRTIDSLLTLIKKDKADTNKVHHLNALGRLLMYENPDTAIILGNEALNIITPVYSQEFISGSAGIEKKELRLVRANTFEHLGVYFFLNADYLKALDYYLKALEIDEELRNRKGIASCLGLIGNVCYLQSDYPKALDYYFRALKIEEELGNKIRIAANFGNIGNIYADQGDNSKALIYYFKTLNINEELGDKAEISICLGNIGIVYYQQINYSKALDYYFKALKIDNELGNKDNCAANFSNIGDVYYQQKNYVKASDYYFKSLKMAENHGDKHEIANVLGNIGLLYIKTGKFKAAEQYLKKAIVIDDSIGVLDGSRQFEESLSKLYDTTGRHKEALIHYKKAITLKDTIFSQENKKQLVRKEMNYEFEKKEAATKAEHDKEMAVGEAEKKKQRIVLILVSGVLLLVFLFAGFVLRSLRLTRKQKNIIELQKNEVMQQKELVEKQTKKIVDSITYAQRIQQSILVEESEVQLYLPNSFIYFQPKDIVSGDFYWCSKVGEKIIIAAIDCTGHGVPGAFMSMIGNTLLNQIVNEKQITTPSEILRHLNIGVYESLHQGKHDALSDDGMDVALCTIDYKNGELQYAGQNPLYILSMGQIEVIKGNIQGIGGGGMIAKIHDPLKREFTNNVIPIKEDMSIYLFTDGYMDQFGGPDRKKFGSQQFKDLLIKTCNLNVKSQKEYFASALAEWKGNKVQIDDVLVIGVRIN